MFLLFFPNVAVALICPGDFSTETDHNSAYASNISLPQPLLQGYEGHMNLTLNHSQESDIFSIGNHTVTWSVSIELAFSVDCNFTISVYGKHEFNLHYTLEVIIHKYFR